MNSTDKKGLIIVISGFSGVGKTTVVNKLLESKDKNIVRITTCTTRAPRNNEENGVDYLFKTKEEFELMIKNNELLEYTIFNGNYYGTPIKPVEDKINKGKDIILVIDVKGLQSIKTKVKDKDIVSIFLFAPPEEIENRLKARGTEDPASIKERLKKMKEEEENMSNYDYIVWNKDIEQTVSDISQIIYVEHLKSFRVLSNKNIIFCGKGGKDDKEFN